MNQCRNSNSKEVLEEKKRLTNPGPSKGAEAWRNANRRKRSAAGEGGQEEKSSGAPALPKGKEYLAETAESVENRERKKKKKCGDAFGWNVFNSEALYRAHDKRLKDVKFHEDEYNEQKVQEDQLAFYGDISKPILGHVPSEDAKERLAEAIEKHNAKRKDFSRRRMYVDDEDRNYVNERNRHFNQKIQRAYGAYTAETQQNLERGTAL